ncbi:DNA polymerase III subunit psi [Erwinia amylovora]|uniref:DNA polymerase III subunit psi n=4 Tax=Erwinia amylovora TaxID=552 RepID=A0A831A4D4_ERWAM|nr:DNA polymerase III subunit psi [Erwinia amylovora]EKV52475.1 DNA polymerase III, psi subunit [Erwinia amylovora ACW56400]CBA22898.1 DNA polymerase III, psi subunit [Erwinia amylovora CFBP1430]CBJ45242.1 DNA polymerase III, psi subunit [Erwinia amylovora ATCC 49946]CBX81929.1 DNA polymerase III, psi subunit [Erwinia amylovora ATCC BAA-2158]CCO79903.1 DNA polymerase III, psi subunit [Erwinia amylovora Ea356]CCO83709.1 DNA polymerase III, psi subunit [Erwinia amylovora Ea266]CCO87467.1 DNA p
MMSPRRDWLLQQMGITQYTLRRPRALQGEIAITLPAETRLVIVADNPPMLHDPLVVDVLRALNLQQPQVQVLTPDQLAMLPDNARCPSWRLGLEAPVTLAGTQIASPVLAELYHNAEAKRSLWQQICQHESDFFTHPARP